MLNIMRQIIWKNYTYNTYCHLRTYRDRCKYLVQSFNYCTEHKRNDFDDDVELSVDPRVEALREKLLYCDYLDRYKVKTSYMKRFLWQKAAEYTAYKAKSKNLIEVPVYSVLLDTKYNNDDNNYLPKQDTNTAHKSEDVDKEDTAKHIHMPYASTDQYTNVDTSLNSKKNEAASTENLNEDILKIPLNEKYKDLYDKYLEAKKVAFPEERVNLKDYIEDSDINKSYKIDFSNVPSNWMVDVEEFDDTLEEQTWLKYYGTPDPNSTVSLVPCSGCGALLHCKDHALPGYLPSELFLEKSEKQLRLMICQRCHFMKYYNTALEVKVSSDKYINLLSAIKHKKCAIILMVDLTDFPCSIWPEISSVLHPATPVFIVGNKIDLLPQDSANFFAHVKDCLSKTIQENTGISKENIKHVALISAKTGYGIEALINKLHNLWKYKGDVYLIGCTNVGKSSLFNTLLHSDYCKVKAVDLIQRATISAWPGTTLNLLKFPILNPLKWRLYQRVMRLKEEQKLRQVEEKFRTEQFKDTGKLRYATLQDRIGRTFSSKSKTASNVPFLEQKYKKGQEQIGFDENLDEYKHSRWCYDTPGTIQPDQILDLLTTQELLTVLPDQIISPRTFIVHANQTIFLAGIGRLDYLEGDKFIRCTIFSSRHIPITLTHTTEADNIYDELLKTKAFVVPENDLNRLKHWPALEPKEMEVICIGKKESVADVVLSNAGWIAISGAENQRVLLRAWTPQGRGLYLRTPALLKRSVALRGIRVKDAPTYRYGRQAYKK